MTLSDKESKGLFLLLVKVTKVESTYYVYCAILNNKGDYIIENNKHKFNLSDESSVISNIKEYYDKFNKIKQYSDKINEITRNW